ncbi:hypothetical protein MKS88_004755 [Plasmodium brasilianum]|uniref:Plasmodium RESA N-terminal domain-containing protein n=2 Tax=Plasmodium (Plasmodium) TaxID=418103 RepID=A0A1A8WIK6_PLAMA|nr:conserved Plasmodium protein, unknown function [Plasmodium malariae]KAI4835545.1 hypothetical protein MKS88_004755 [Plasmodium brasilianum]SBS92777.1 Plasmodium exported protein (PHIST), unknown function [Plasmodium malariae]SCP02467.1 conserved Plasmodium protein, unknown function [Plasmodium malariae]
MENRLTKKEDNSASIDNAIKYNVSSENGAPDTEEEKGTDYDALEKIYQQLLSEDKSKDELQGKVYCNENTHHESIGQQIYDRMMASNDGGITYDCNASDLWKKMKDGVFNMNDAILYGIVDYRNACVVYKHFHKLEKEKYIEIRDLLWKLCVTIETLYNIQKEIVAKEWDNLSSCVLSDILKRDQRDYSDLHNLILGGNCTTLKFVEFIYNKRLSWLYTTDTIFYLWAEVLSFRLIHHGE